MRDALEGMLNNEQNFEILVNLNMEEQIRQLGEIGLNERRNN